MTMQQNTQQGADTRGQEQGKGFGRGRRRRGMGAGRGMGPVAAVTDQRFMQAEQAVVPAGQIGGPVEADAFAPLRKRRRAGGAAGFRGGRG